MVICFSRMVISLSRRKMIKASIGAVIAVTASAVALVRTATRYPIDSDVRARLVSLSPAQYNIVRALAARVCAADKPGEVVGPDATDVVGFVDAYVARMPSKMRRDLFRFFNYVEQLAPAALGFASRFTQLDAADQDRVLASLESSSIDLLRGGFEGVKALLFMGYYKDPRTWTILGYDGPTLGRP